MIPGNFEYHRPSSVDEALALLERYGDDGRVLAGGHSLIPMMKLRFAEPAHLIDLQALDDLTGIAEAGGEIRIGAMTTQAEILDSPLLAERCPILPETSGLTADPQVRYCGTVGGNVANGDPGNDMPAVMIALGASYVLKSHSGERAVQADGFYKGIYATALEANELLTEIRIPTPRPGHGYAYQKMKRKVGDYATAAAAVVLTLEGGACTQAAIALTNLGATPLSAADAAASLIGREVDDAAVGEAAERAMQIADPADDLRGPAEFRKHRAGEMTRRAIRAALGRAKGG